MGFMKVDINLARVRSAEFDRVRWFKSVTVVLCAAAIFISLFNAVSYGLSRVAVDRYEETVEAAGSDVPVAKEIDRSELRRLNSEVAIVNSIIAMESFSWTSLLTSLEDTLPGSVALVQISPDFKSGSIRMRAMGETIGGALEFVDALNEAEEFSEAFLLSHSEKDTGNKTRSREKILFDLSVLYSESDSESEDDNDGNNEAVER